MHAPRFTILSRRKSLAVISLTASIALLAQPSVGQTETTRWYSSANENAGSASYAWSSGCTSNCNDENDFRTFISLDCTKAGKMVSAIFWSLGREADDGKSVRVWVRIDGNTTWLETMGSPALEGVSLSTQLPLDSPLLEEIAAGHSLIYGSEAAGGESSASLTGSRKAITTMQAACR